MFVFCCFKLCLVVFSYYLFLKRDLLREYFVNALDSLVSDGILFLDAYGGPEAQEPLEEPREMAEGFTYTWDQHSFNPIDNSIVNYIHFDFRDGSKMRKAFTYEWRFWNLNELQELLLEAGFSKVTVFWEGADEDGDGNGIWRARKTVEQETAWICYIAVEK